MPEKISIFYFEDILESIEKIRRYLGNASYDEFLENEMLIDAVVRNLEIIRFLILKVVAYPFSFISQVFFALSRFAGHKKLTE
jgi:Uncharacterized conserved protein